MIDISKFGEKCTCLMALTAVLFCFSCAEKKTEVNDWSINWTKRDSIVASIQLPKFKNKEFNVMDYGAVADGLVLNTDAIDAAIKACNASGGGKVIVPPGKYLTRPIHLLDNINLEIQEGAEVLFSTDQNLYPIVHTSYEGTELMNFSPLIYAKGKSNIAITGKGVLNGQADINNWWPWSGKDTYGWKEGAPRQQTSLKKLKEGMSEKGVSVEERIFGMGEFLRPTFIEPFECKNVLIKDITIINAPFWVIHPLKSNNVVIDGVTVDSHGPNNDGCDPEYSKNVWIKNCTFNTGDDCIAIKSGRNEDGRRVAIPSENIVIENCKMIDGHGGVVMGSEISAGVRNVFVQKCEMNSPNLDRAIRIKTNTKRGGFAKDVFVRDLTIGQVKEAVLKINLFYGTYANQTGDYMPTVENVILENIMVENGGKYGVLIEGYQDSPVNKVVLANVNIKKVDSAFALRGVKDLEVFNSSINGKEFDNLKLNN